MRLIVESDTHGVHDHVPVPDGDIYIHAGDFTSMGREQEVLSFASFLNRLPHKHKIVIAGNHDVSFERDAENARRWLGDSCVYLENSGTEIDGLKFWGSPAHPFFDSSGTWVFGVKENEIENVWDKIPEDTDILITHGGPKGILDKITTDVRCGCPKLLKVVERVKPKVHIFGHLHEAAGVSKNADTLFVNAAVLDEKYRLVRGCTIIEL